MTSPEKIIIAELIRNVATHVKTFVNTVAEEIEGAVSVYVDFVGAEERAAAAADAATLQAKEAKRPMTFGARTNDD